MNPIDLNLEPPILAVRKINNNQYREQVQNSFSVKYIKLRNDVKKFDDQYENKENKSTVKSRFY